MRDRAGVRLPLELRIGPDLAHQLHDARIVVSVALGVDGVVEEDAAAGRDELAPAPVVGARALVAVVAVDEDELARARRRIGGAGVGDEQVDAFGEAEALERGAEVGVELGPLRSARSATWRSYDQSSAPSGSALARSRVLPPLKRPISATAAPGETFRARR